MRWIAAFGENNICLGSIDSTENIDIDSVLNSVTSRNTSYYIKPDFIQKVDQSQVNFAAFEYIPLGNGHSFIIDFIINYQQEIQLQLSPTFATLNLQSIWIRSQEVMIIFNTSFHPPLRKHHLVLDYFLLIQLIQFHLLLIFVQSKNII